MVGKKSLTIILCIMAGYLSPLLCMQTESQWPRIAALRNTINEKRAFRSKVCCAASTLFSAAAGGLAGWYAYNHSAYLPIFLQLSSPAERALMSGAGIGILTLATSWLTKHYGMYHFLTHHGHLRQLKNQLNSKLNDEKNTRNSEAEIVSSNLKRIRHLNRRIRDDQSQIQQNNKRHTDYQQQVNHQKSQSIMTAQKLTQQLQTELNSLEAEKLLNITAAPDLEVLKVNKEELENQLIFAINASQGNLKDPQWILTYWLKIQQIIDALATKLQELAAVQTAAAPDADKTKAEPAPSIARQVIAALATVIFRAPVPQADQTTDTIQPQAEPVKTPQAQPEISEVARHALRPVLKLALEQKNVRLCANLACCGLKLNELCPLDDQQFFANLNLTNEIIIPFCKEEDEEKRARCPICFEDYDDQKQAEVLSCGHILCHDCREILIKRINTGETTNKCHVCREKTMLHKSQ